MLNLYGPGVNASEPLARREMLRIGGLGLSSVSLSGLLSRSALAAESQAAKPASFGKAKNCIVLFLSGGMSHHDTFDPKPHAPDDVRGDFQTIDTVVPGTRITEHLPRSAKLMDRATVIRSMTHKWNGHSGGGYVMFTGYDYDGSEGDANFSNRNDHPHLGAALSKVAPGPGPMVPFVLAPRRLDAGSGRRAGQSGGRLGGKYDPLQTGGNPNDDDFKLDHLPLVANRAPEVLRRRTRLIEQVNNQVAFLENTALARSLSQNQTRALDVISSEAVRRAVDLSTADPDERNRYGRNLFGQSVLLSRRMIDAGTRLAQATWLRTQGKKGYAWDSHWDNCEALADDLIPPFDQALESLITDLEERGQLDETLVVVAGEFGRTPRITLKTQGREHWSNCFSVLLFGGGIKGGQIYGASDKIGAYPESDPVSPADLTATIYHLLGLDPEHEILDQNDRPMRLSEGVPLTSLMI
ncbi:MAG: hypothetical protein CMJ59_11180 [Planctomycetaceae bacterium]|nr:hypothetical protein [Planctomycetaceae bacterium]